MNGDAAQRVRLVLEQVVARHDLFLEDVAISAAGRRRLVRVTVDLPDGPGGVGSEALADVSHAISAALDDADVFEGAYVLEVSTPGTDRPLRDGRHYRRAVGRLVRVRTRSGERLAGRLVAADAETVTVDVDGASRHLALTELAEGSIEVELTHLQGEEG